MYKKGERAKQSQDTRNSGVLKSWINRWVWASYANYDQIEKELVRDKKDYSLLKHQNKHAGEPALIVGAGISLEKLIPILKDWKGAIFTSESMASTLKYYGHQPEYICLFDGNQTAWKLFFEYQNFKGSTLVTHPSVDPKVIELWRGPKIYYLMMHYAKLFDQETWKDKPLPEMEKMIKDQLIGYDFFENILPSVYSMVGASILNAGCVVNNAIEVANFMGYGPLFLCGVDFGFKDWINRYPGMMKVKGKWVAEGTKIIEHEDEEGKIVGDININREFIISDNGIPTTAEQAEYKLALLSVYKLDRPQLFDCSDGIITELPKLDIKEVVEKNGKGFEGNYRTDKEIVECSNAYFNRK